MNEQNISLDVSKSASISQVVRIGQGDKSGTTIVASIYDNGATLSLSGKTARFNMRLPGGAGYVRDTACTVSGNNITYVVNEQYCASVVGITSEVYFEIMQGTSVIASTQRFSIQVLRSVLDGMKPAESWDNAIDELINRGNEKLDEIDESLITQASATIDDNVGTPNVSVSLSQRTPSTLGKLLSFAFHNIKGNTGATGPQGPKGDKGDTVSVEPITNSEIDTVASDGQLTSLHALDGTGLTYLWSKLKTKFASLVNGTVAVTQGGTGATSAAGARTNLGVPSTTDLANIESSMAYVEAVTAKKNHAVGDYFMLGDVLMRTTAAIAAGETINASKATPATLQGQIDTLRDSVLPSTYSTTVYGLLLYSAGDILMACVSKPIGKTVSNVSTNYTTTFNLDPVGGTGSVISGAKFASIEIAYQTGNQVILRIKIDKPTVNAVTYRFSATVPLITLS